MSKKFAIFLVACASLLSSAYAELTGFYALIDPVPFDPHGWFVNERPLDAIFKENQIKTVIELGSWAGLSTRFFAHRVGKEGKVYAIDTWKGTASNRAQMKDPRLPQLFRLFLSNAIHQELTDIIVPIPMTTDDAAKCFNIKADLIYVDADHDESQVYKDIINWTAHLNENGILCGNDWNLMSVQSAVKRAASQLGRSIDVDEREIFWRIR